MRLRSALPVLLALLPCAPGPASAATLRVGPGEAVERLADAARLARDGDTVLVLPGEYRGDVAVWQQRRLTIRGADPRPVLVGDGRSAEGKAIWVVRDGDITIDNIEFRGARAPAGNGAGIRFERGRLQVRNCVFVDNQTGILTGNLPDSELDIVDSLFADAPRQSGSLPHLLYVGRIARVTIAGSRFHNGYRGHLVKSRARVSELRYNLLVDGPLGAASYEADFPEGGRVTLVGNVIAQSAATQNRTLLSYGAERGRWPENRLALVHNTFVSDDGAPAKFVQVWQERIGGGATVTVRNNLTVGTGRLTVAAPEGNAALPPGGLPGAGMLDFALPQPGASGRIRPVAPVLDPDLEPRAEFALPIGTRPLSTPQRWWPGAFQR